MGNSSFIEKSEITSIKHLSDVTGLLAFYSFFVIIGYTFQGTVVLFISELYYALLLAIALPFLYAFRNLVKIYQKTIFELALLSLSVLINLIILIIPAFFEAFISPDFLLGLLKLIELTMYALIIVDISEVLSVQGRLQISNISLITGAFLLSIRLPETLFLGLLLIAFGFGSLSKILRRSYYIELRLFKQRSEST